MKDSRELEQVFRCDGANCFMEIMLTGLTYDKVLINFTQYDVSQPKNQRITGNVGIFMDMFEAQRLARDIMSGRICALGEKAKEIAKKNNKQYAQNIFESSGGTSAANRPDGRAVARSFSIAPGARQPWILCARQGAGEEIGSGLIKMAGKPDVTIRVPVTNEKLKEFALAIEAVVGIWTRMRFDPVAKPIMETALERRMEAIEKAKANSVTNKVAGNLIA